MINQEDLRELDLIENKILEIRMNLIVNPRDKKAKKQLQLLATRLLRFTEKL